LPIQQLKNYTPQAFDGGQEMSHFLPKEAVANHRFSKFVQTRRFRGSIQPGYRQNCVLLHQERMSSVPDRENAERHEPNFSLDCG
jgi:hypothetical protein